MNIWERSSDFSFHLRLPFFFPLCIFVQLTLWIFSCTFPVHHALVSKGFSHSPSKILGFQVGTSWGYPQPSTSGSEEHPSLQRGEEQSSIWGIPGGSLGREKHRGRSSLSLEYWDQTRESIHLPGCFAGLVSPGLATIRALQHGKGEVKHFLLI